MSSITLDPSKFTMPSIQSPTVTDGEVNSVENTALQDTLNRVENLRVSMAQSMGVSVDELSGSSTLARAQSQLNNISEKYSSTSSSTSSEYTKAYTAASTASAMFDIYSVMNLIQQTSQELRSAMREMRQLENSVIQSTIKAEAQSQRNAALANLITGAVTFVIQAAVTIGSAAMQMKSLTKQANAQTAQGVDVAKAQSNMAANAQASTEVATEQVQTTAAKTSEAVQSGVDESFSTAESEARAGIPAEDQQAVTSTKAELDTAKADLKTLQDQASAKANVAAKQTEVQNAQAEVDRMNQPGSGATEAQKTHAAVELRNAQSDLLSAQQAETTANQAVDAIPGERRPASVDAAQQKVDTAQTNYDQASAKVEASYQKTLCDKAGKLGVEAQKDYDTALKQANAYKDSHGGQSSPELDAKLDASSQKLLYTRAMEAKTYALNGGEARLDNLSENLSADLKTRIDLSDKAGTTMTRAIVMGQMTSTIASTIGTLGKSIGDYFAAEQTAEGTELRANEEMAKEQLDQIKDMFQQMLTTIDKVINIYSSVIQQESQSIDELANAIRA